jgi:hypothetical protein
MPSILATSLVSYIWHHVPCLSAHRRSHRRRVLPVLLCPDPHRKLNLYMFRRFRLTNSSPLARHQPILDLSGSTAHL